jgi:hypothetical protein
MTKSNDFNLTNFIEKIVKANDIKKYVWEQV